MKNILMIPGDGIGPEVTSHAQQLLQLLSKKYDFGIAVTEVDWGAERWLRYKEGIPEGELEQIPNKYDAILFGALGDPRIPDMAHGRAILLGLRTKLELYINFRPVKLLHPRLSTLKKQCDVDIAIFRENTQDIYGAVGGAINQGSTDEIAIDESIHSYKGVERIIESAFLYATKMNRKRVCLVDKSNAIKFGGSLWQRVFKSKAKEYPQVKAEHLFVDVAAMQMVQSPENFEVIVTSNLFGDILSDLGAGLVGGLGVAASANINPKTVALFEPVHGSAPNLVGKNTANPFAMFLSLGMMLEYLGFSDLKGLIEKSVTFAIEKSVCTPDLGGRHTSTEVSSFIMDYIKEAA
ncbi:MAG: isocitrate/isopropylmalate dehydrogenase family protein [Myxococcales bacterium]|nr:isocitrate/isopropylmalate dehydrogenase family protein [Myxococcales bacterium]USN50949.1 MAG: isocitrate/isopropylmalate dehydrogenase family protein [Myxococcales bacterium]